VHHTACSGEKSVEDTEQFFIAFHIEPPNVNLWGYFIAEKERYCIERRNSIERYVMSKCIYTYSDVRIESVHWSLRNCPILRNSITRLLDATFSISEHVNKRFKLHSAYNFFLSVDPTF